MISGGPPVNTSGRLGVITTAGDFYAKEGDLHAHWVKEMGGVRAIALSGNRLGVITTAGDFYAKEGDLHASWVREGGDARAIAMATSA